MKMTHVLIDAYGTVFDVEAIAQTCDHWFPGNGEIISRLWRRKQLEYTWLCALMDQYIDFEEVNQRSLTFALEELHKHPSQEALTAMLDAYLSLPAHPDAIPALSSWDGAQVSILSNGTPRMLEAMVANAGLSKTIDGIYSVDSVGTYKPSPRVYEHGVTQTGAKPADITFISSNGWDAAGAKAYGFRTIWANRKHQPVERIAPAPDYVVDDLSFVTAQMLEGQQL